jgi:ubiquinone/menaquinone biosynthesis C-methylase UbiE
MDEARLWDSLAKRYDRIVRVFDSSYDAVREMLEEDLQGRARVLEVGAGTGQFTLDLARVASSVLATDVAPDMVARLRFRLREADAFNVRSAVMSATELDAPDGSFDAAFCANALHVMEDPRRALRELRRVLAPDGLLVAPTFLHGSDPARRMLSSVLSTVSPFVAHTRLNLGGLGALVAGEGFVVDRLRQLPGVFPIGYVSARPDRSGDGA